MRVLVAPGSFGATLSAVAAADAIAAGWSRRAPEDELVLAPVSDAGIGFVDVLHAALTGELLSVSVTRADGDLVDASVLLVGETAYVDTARVVGPVPEAGRAALGPSTDPERATSVAVGQLVGAALGTGVSRIVIGIAPEGVITNDGGAGVLDALGATADPPDALQCGPARLATLAAVELGRARAAVGSTRLELATDDDTPLLGLLGTTNVAGEGRGIAADRVSVVDGQLARLADLVGRRHVLSKGAGAGGGIGFALLTLGAVRAPGLGTVLAELGFAALAAHADLVVTGEEALDFAAGSGRVSAGVAAVAATAARPCIALADRMLVSAREMRAMGIESAYAVRDLVAASGDPAGELAALAERVARTWSWRR